MPVVRYEAGELNPSGDSPPRWFPPEIPPG